MSGYTTLHVAGNEIKIHAATDSILYQAAAYYKELYEESDKAGILTEAEMQLFLIEQGFWTKEKNKLLDDLVKSIDDLKVRIYNAVFSSKDLLRYKHALRETERQIMELTAEKSTYTGYTCEGVASYGRAQFLIEKTARIGGKPCDWTSISLPLVFSSLQTSIIPDKTLRLLSHTDPWTGIWQSRKYGKLFKNKYLSDEQKRLAAWSNMYENIYKHPDCPHDSIIDDDDMLDGWNIIQRREREKTQKQKRLDNKLTGKIANSDEVFIVAQTPEDAKAIFDMNDEHAKRIIANRKRKINSSNRDLNFTEFDDVQVKILNELHKGK